MSDHAAHVAVGGLDPAAVGDDDLAAVTAVPAGGDNSARSGGDDRRAHRRGEVDALVHPGIAEDRMETLAEARGHMARDRKAHGRRGFTADAVGIEPDDGLAVGPFEELDVGAGDTVETRIDELPGLPVLAAQDDEVEF